VHAGVMGNIPHVILDKLTIHHLILCAPLLRNIRHVRLFLADFDGQAIYPHIIIGAKLCTLRISHDIPSEEHDTSASDHLPWKNMVSALRTSMVVRRLSFDPEIKYDGVIPGDCETDLVVLSRRFLCLEHLSGLPLPMDIPSLQHFTASSIRSLELKITPEIACQFSSLPCSHPLFPNLEELSLETDDISAVQCILACDGFENLASLGVIIQHYHTPCDVSLIFNLIARNKPNIKLESLQISDDNPRNIALVSPPDFLTIEPILLYHDLTILDIDIAHSVILDDQVLGCMVEAWPCLQELHLRDWTNPCSQSTNVTLHGILMLNRCSQLTSISLRVDARSPIPNLRDVVPAPELEYFCVCRSPATYSSNLVQFLRMVFPVLHEITYGYSHHHIGFGFGSQQDGPIAQEELYFECWREIWNVLCNGMLVRDLECAV
jgi:hypothetical protein